MRCPNAVTPGCRPGISCTTTTAGPAPARYTSCVWPPCENVVTSNPGTAPVMSCSLLTGRGLLCQRRLRRPGVKAIRKGVKPSERMRRFPGCRAALYCFPWPAEAAIIAARTGTGRPAAAASAELAAAGRLVPVGEVRLDPDPPRRVVDERRLRPADQAVERGEVGGLPEGRPLVQVAGVAPEVAELGEPPRGDPGHRVVPGVEARQGRPQPHVGLGDLGAEQVPAGGQAVVEFGQGGEHRLPEVLVVLPRGGPGDPVRAVVHAGVHALVQRVDLGAPRLRVEVGRWRGQGAELGAEVDRDVREIVADD